MNLTEDTFAKEEGSLTAIDIKHEQTKEEICELEAEDCDQGSKRKVKGEAGKD